MTSFNFKKSALAVSASAALLALSLTTTAQAANDVAQIIINGQISNSTCLLSLGDGGATGGNSKTINLGTYSVAAAGSVPYGNLVGVQGRVDLSLKAADGVTPCNFISPTAFWDVGINIPPANYETLTTGLPVLKNTATTDAATGIGVAIEAASGPINSKMVWVNFGVGSPTYGTLLSDSANTSPALPASNWLVLYPKLVRTAGPVSAGVYTHTIPLNVYYR